MRICSRSPKAEEVGFHASRILCSVSARRLSLGRLSMLQALYASRTISRAISFTCLDGSFVRSRLSVKVVMRFLGLSRLSDDEDD